MPFFHYLMCTSSNQMGTATCYIYTDWYLFKGFKSFFFYTFLCIFFSWLNKEWRQNNPEQFLIVSWIYYNIYSWIDPLLVYSIYGVAGTVDGARRTCCSKRAASRWVIPPTTRSPRLRAAGSWRTCSYHAHQVSILSEQPIWRTKMPSTTNKYHRQSTIECEKHNAWIMDNSS